MTITSVRYIEVNADHSGQRLDNYLITVLKGVPLSRIYRIIRKGEVRINRGRAQPSRRLQSGDVVRIPPIRQAETVDLSDNPLLKGLAQRLQGQIIYQDDAMLVLNKPSGIAVHGGSGLHGGVIEALRQQAFSSSFLELAHRLDRQTSGCLVLARSRPALLDLQQQIGGGKMRDTKKYYLALLPGRWQGGDRRVSDKLRKNQLLSGERMVVASDSGKTAESIFHPLALANVASLVRIELLTGRTHQARVHAALCGKPIAGDSKYGDREFNRTMQGHGLQRLFLHASVLRLYHPVSHEPMLFHAPLPMDLQRVGNSLGLDCETVTVS